METKILGLTLLTTTELTFLVNFSADRAGHGHTSIWGMYFMLASPSF